MAQARVAFVGILHWHAPWYWGGYVKAKHAHQREPGEGHVAQAHVIKGAKVIQSTRTSGNQVKGTWRRHASRLWGFYTGMRHGAGVDMSKQSTRTSGNQVKGTWRRRTSRPNSSGL